MSGFRSLRQDAIREALVQASIKVLRWDLLRVIYATRPDFVRVRAIRAAFGELVGSEKDLLRELAYLQECGLVRLSDLPFLDTKAELTSDGIDFFEYTSKCRPGIDRPPRGRDA